MAGSDYPTARGFKSSPGDSNQSHAGKWPMGKLPIHLEVTVDPLSTSESTTFMEYLPQEENRWEMAGVRQHEPQSTFFISCFFSCR